MKRGTALVKQAARPRWWRTVAALSAFFALSAGVVIWLNQRTPELSSTQTTVTTNTTTLQTPLKKPLADRSLYSDTERSIVQITKNYQATNNTEYARLADRVSSQPGVTWLNGPHESDPNATGDINTVQRTSAAAAAANAVAVYQLYAIPKRDACAGYSAGGFKTTKAYLEWLDGIVGALAGDAVFLIETDSIAQTIRTECLTPNEVEERYDLLATIGQRLAQSPRVLASYLDAGHSEWFPDPSVLVEPLKKSGINVVRGVSVNVANFVSTTELTPWSQQLVELLGDSKGVVIDTSRNGRGAPPVTVTGTARWCNPPTAGLGALPTTSVSDPHVDAYLWVKNIGESDGECFGNPPAGTFSEQLLMSIARQAAL